jgi:hypothetical protein
VSEKWPVAQTPCEYWGPELVFMVFRKTHSCDFAIRSLAPEPPCSSYHRSGGYSRITVDLPNHPTPAQHLAARLLTARDVIDTPKWH